MNLPNKKFREIILLLLYSYDFSQEEENCFEIIMKECKISKKYLLQAAEICLRIRENFETIDGLISGASFAYEFERIPRIERNILRLGVHELLYSSQVPGTVAIAEAIRLAKKFATPESGSFVNAILDTIRKRSIDTNRVIPS